MRVNITYTLNNDPSQQFVDMVNWPDLPAIDVVTPYVAQYLDAKYGANTYQIVSIEAA